MNKTLYLYTIILNDSFNTEIAIVAEDKLQAANRSLTFFHWFTSTLVSLVLTQQHSNPKSEK